MELRNKFAVVTGASVGIGKATAIALASKGAHVALVARSREKLQETKKAIENKRGSAEIFETDLSSFLSLNTSIKKIRSGTDHVDILVNVADVWHLNGKQYFETEFKNIPQELIVKSFDVGLKAALLLTQAFYPFMKGWGRIINISGSFSPNEIGCLPQYVTKKGVEVFTKQLALEMKDKGITVNAISPWYVWTESVQKLFPSLHHEAISPEYVAEQIVSLCIDEADMVTGKVISLRKNQKPQVTEL